MKLSNETIGKNLKNNLFRLDISQTDFTKTISSNKATVSDIINGKYEPSVDFIKKVAKAYPDWDLANIFGQLAVEYAQILEESTEEYRKTPKDKLIEALEKENADLKEQVRTLTKVLGKLVGEEESKE